jgi:hypothetical protein
MALRCVILLAVLGWLASAAAVARRIQRAARAGETL